MCDMRDMDPHGSWIHWASREPSLKRRTMSLPNCDNSCGRGPMDGTNGSQSKLK